MLTAHLKSDTKFSWEILDLYSDFIKFTAEKVEVVLSILRSFLITELLVFKSKLKTQLLNCTNRISKAQQPHVANISHT